MLNNPLTTLAALLGTPQEHRASDGSLWPTAGLAWFHDVLETDFQRHIDVARDGRNVRLVRESLLRISQAELASAAGITQAFLSFLESGHRRASVKKTRAIWAAFGKIANQQAAQRARAEQEIKLRLEGQSIVVTEKIACGG